VDVCLFARFQVNCQVAPLRRFANFELVVERSCARSQSAGRGPWHIWPMRKPVTASVPSKKFLHCENVGFSEHENVWLR